MATKDARWFERKMEILHWRAARAEGDARAEVVMASKQVVGCLVEIWQIDASGRSRCCHVFNFFLPAFGLWGGGPLQGTAAFCHSALASAE